MTGQRDNLLCCGIYRLRDDGTKELVRESAGEWELDLAERDLEPGWYEARAIVPSEHNDGAALELLRAFRVPARRIEIRFAGCRALAPSGAPAGTGERRNPYLAIDGY